jgi:hypothetical protein
MNGCLPHNRNTPSSRVAASNRRLTVPLRYTPMLKCFVVIDLKTGKLSYQDIGQIDFYVRYFDDQIKLPEDNPTLGIILCADKNKTMAKYSVLSDKKNLLASKYMLYLPTEEELKKELERERMVIERKLAEDSVRG